MIYRIKKRILDPYTKAFVNIPYYAGNDHHMSTTAGLGTRFIYKIEKRIFDPCIKALQTLYTMQVAIMS